MPPLLSCDDVRREINNRTIDRIAALRARPLVRIWDKDWSNGLGEWKPVAIVHGEILGDFEEKLHDTGEGKLNLLSSHRLRDWLIDELDEAADVHITVDIPGWRWHGKALTIEEVQEEDGLEYVAMTFLHSREHAKKLICFPNPFLPAITQWPKYFNWAGSAMTGIATMMMLNFIRRYGIIGKLTDNLFQPGTWAASINPANWPQIVNPRGLGLDDKSMWTSFTARMGNLHDVILPVLKDTGIQLKCDLFLPGEDEQPCPEWFTLTRPTLVWSLVDKSGVRGPTGTVFDGLLKLVAQVAQDGFSDVVTEAPIGGAPEEYGRPGWFGTVAEWPWVSWRNSMRYAKERGTGMSGVKTWRMVVHKALAGAIVTGGKSPAWINAATKLLLNAALGYLGAIIGNPGLALGIFDKQVEDVILAFQRVTHAIRQALMGSRFAYGEHWEPSANGFSTSTLAAIRMGMWATRAYTSFKVKVVNGAPYWVGRHFTLGDRVSAEIGRSRRLYVDQVHALRYAWSRSKDPDFEISIGDDSEEEAPTARLGRFVERFKAQLQTIGVDS